MMTIAQAFQSFLEKLELRASERDDASKQHSYLRESLSQHMDIEDNFLSGSYARSTAIRPLNDIDIFLVLKQSQALNPSVAPEKVLTEVQTTLEAIYPNKRAKLQTRSVNIEFSTTGIAYDVVPAFLGDKAGVYKLPDRDTPQWIETNPKIHSELSVQANKAAGNKLKPLVKAVKHAKNVHGSEARSFHLEVLAWQILTSPPDNYLAGLKILLEGLVARICLPCPDPAGLGPDIQPSAAKCQTAQVWLNRMVDLVREADSHTRDGRIGEAHGRLRELFGEEWPEQGTSGNRSRGGAVLIGTGSVDHSGSRFG